MTTRHLLIAAASLMICAVAQADVYRWLDANGVVHYTDTPPEGVESTLVPVDSRSTDKLAIESQRKASIGREQAQMLINQETKAEASEEQAALAEHEAALEKACAEAQARVFSYEHSHRLYRELPSGEREYYTDEEITQARDDANKAVEKFCK
ncbi:MAG: DUF4124 domain-containing protein [Gammaproteobacteria bacterium]|nr:DUF4124 domain-containing protein [Gammaproteobacteria bacterium]